MKFWKRSYFHHLLYPMNSLTYILMVSVILHHLWLLMSLMNCCGPLMEMIFMCSALNFIHLMLRFLLINFLLIPFNCILILISLLFIFTYNILSLSGGGRPFHPSVPFRPVIHPSKFLIPEEEDDGRGGGGMATTTVYPNIYVIQSCSLWKTLVVLQFAKSYKLILRN